MRDEFEQLVVELAEHQRGRYFGKYRGKVREIGEGENLGLIKVTVPEIYGDEDEIESPWAVPCVPFAGAGHGLVALPEVEDGVWVEFEAGDISRPIWTGFWWADDEMPEPKGVLVRTFITTAGHKLILDDDAGEVHLLHADGAKLTMTDSEITLEIGQASITMSDGEISLKVSSAGVIKISSSGVDIGNGAVRTS
jgi:uncharacterized protein involved in type VI secretion and phage assembly